VRYLDQLEKRTARELRKRSLAKSTGARSIPRRTFFERAGYCDMNRLVHSRTGTSMSNLFRHELRFHGRLRSVVNHCVGVFHAHAISASLSINQCGVSRQRTFLPIHSYPTGCSGNGSSQTRRKRAMPRHHKRSWFPWMPIDVVRSAVTNELPALAHETAKHLGRILFRRGHLDLYAHIGA